jgi:hypothetical protein
MIQFGSPRNGQPIDQKRVHIGGSRDGRDQQLSR